MQRPGTLPWHSGILATPTRRTWLIVGMAGLLLMMTTLAVGWAFSGRTPTEDFSDVESSLNVEVSRDRGKFYPVTDFRSLRAGDAIRFSASFSEPVYAGLYWIDAKAQVGELYPNIPGQGFHGDQPIRKLESPVQVDRGWPLEPAGNSEVALLIASRTPNAENVGEADWSADDFPRIQTVQSYTANPDFVVSGKPGSRTRSLGHTTTQTNDPIRRLVERLRRIENVLLIEAVHVPTDAVSLTTRSPASLAFPNRDKLINTLDQSCVPLADPSLQTVFRPLRLNQRAELKMSLRISLPLHVAFLSSVLIGAAFGQTDNPAPNSPPTLESVFSGRLRYRHSGRLQSYRAKSRGNLEVSHSPRGASIERRINGGSWATVNLRLEPKTLTEDETQSEIRVWFMLEGATPFYVRLRSALENGEPVQSIALVDTGEKDGIPIEQLVREMVVDNAELSNVQVEYRKGLIAVSISGRKSLRSYIDNDTATVRSVVIAGTQANPSLRLSSASAFTREPKQITDAERQQLARAVTDDQKLLRLYRQGRFEDAARLGERVLNVRKQVLGEDHPRYTMSLCNLGNL